MNQGNCMETMNNIQCNKKLLIQNTIIELHIKSNLYLNYGILWIFYKNDTNQIKIIIFYIPVTKHCNAHYTLEFA